MRREFDEEFSESRRFQDADDALEVAAESRLLQQSLETLREGFSWVNHFQRLHPGYRFAAGDSIPALNPVPELIDANLAVVTTAGVCIEGQRSFAISPGEVEDEFFLQKFKEKGDSTFRRIPVGIDPGQLILVHPYLESSGAREDINTVFPLTRLLELEEESFIGSVAQNHLSFMGYLPNPHDVFLHLDEAVEQLKEDEVNLVLLTPGEILSHQTMVLIQRAIEEAGIATISVALCRDLAELLGVPRAVHFRHPFGFTFGEANEGAMQIRILKDTLRAALEVTESGTIIDLPYIWAEE